MEDLFLTLLQISLGVCDKLSRTPNSREWERLYELAEEQAIVGLLLTGLESLPPEQLPPLELKLQWIGEAQIIQYENKMMDKAVVNLCQEMGKAGIRIFVFKGQTLAALYPDGSLRQSGDIDFYCHPEDWDHALQWFRDKWDVEYPDVINTEKDVEFEYNDVIYEMHNRLTLFANSRHSRYWEQVVMPEILTHPFSVDIDGNAVPTLAPLYNVLFVFVHIFRHLISDGIGLRQFVDLYYLMKVIKWQKEDVYLLERYLEGIGLKKAFKGLGAILTDYFELPEESFPFVIKNDDHKAAPALMTNILAYGNFGQNKEYFRNSGIIHGIQHLWRIIQQSWQFGHYSLSESWGRIPYLIKWWVKKLNTIAKKKQE